jgi:ElaA protein
VAAPSGDDNNRVTSLRSGTFSDLDARTAYLLWQLRGCVFVVEQDCAYLDLDGRDLEPGTRHLWVEDGDRPVAYLRMLEEPDGSRRIGRVLTARSHRGRGLAERLVREAITGLDGRACRLDAQAHLEGWYARIGFARCGADFVEDGIPHVPMLLAAG